MVLLRSTWLMFRTHLISVVRSKRALICLVLALGPPAIAYLPPWRMPALVVVIILGMMLLLQVVAPLIGLIAGTAVLTEELENRTITYAFTRPVPRASLFLGRALATVLLVTALLVPSAFGVWHLATLRPVPTHAAQAEAVEVVETSVEDVDAKGYHARGARELPPGLGPRLVLAAGLAGALYAVLTAALGIFVRRPMIVGLFYLVAMEGFLANIPGSSQKVTLQYYLRGIFTNLGARDSAFFREAEMLANTAFLSPTESAVRLGVLLVLALVVSVWAISRREFVRSA